METKKRFKADRFDVYYYISSRGLVVPGFHLTEFDNLTYKFGNYFRTYEQASGIRDKVKEVFLNYHKEIGD